MNSNNSCRFLRLRAHHICCLPFARWEFEERGSAYDRVRNMIISILHSQPESEVMVVEGVDELCRHCPLCIDARCASPKGNEDEVRKWDAILLKELDLPFGTCLTSGEWRALIKRKTPFNLCQRCQWQQLCSVGTKPA